MAALIRPPNLMFTFASELCSFAPSLAVARAHWSPATLAAARASGRRWPLLTQPAAGPRRPSSGSGDEPGAGDTRAKCRLIRVAPLALALELLDRSPRVGRIRWAGCLSLVTTRSRPDIWVATCRRNSLHVIVTRRRFRDPEVSSRKEDWSLQSRHSVFVS